MNSQVEQPAPSRLVSAVALVLVLLAARINAAPNPFESPGEVKPETQIDKLVFARLDKLGIQPAALCTDPVFVRRAYLDIIGTLPSGYEAKEFILDKNPNKRAALIDKLLARDEFAGRNKRRRDRTRRPCAATASPNTCRW